MSGKVNNIKNIFIIIFIIIIVFIELVACRDPAIRY